MLPIFKVELKQKNTCVLKQSGLEYKYNSIDNLLKLFL